MAVFPRTLRVGVFVYEGFEPIDVWGFSEAFAISRFLGKGYLSLPPHPFEIVLISKDGNKVKSMNGPSVAPDLDFAQARAPAETMDLLMVPGGNTGPLVEVSDAEFAPLRDWVHAMDAKVQIMASVCTGAAVLAKAGLLDGLPAATNHQAFGWVASFGPKVKWDNVSRWVDAGKYVTSAGVSAGTDMGFYLVSRLAGLAVAETAAITAEYDWHRDPKAPIFYPQQAKIKPGNDDN
jgi:putative intracellular protease/amidase